MDDLARDEGLPPFVEPIRTLGWRRIVWPLTTPSLHTVPPLRLSSHLRSPSASPLGSSSPGSSPSSRATGVVSPPSPSPPSQTWCCAVSGGPSSPLSCSAPPSPAPTAPWSSGSSPNMDRGLQYFSYRSTEHRLLHDDWVCRPLDEENPRLVATTASGFI